MNTEITTTESIEARYAALVCGSQIQVDRSGCGNAWRDIDAQDIPHAVKNEIEGEIIDGGKEAVDEFLASNGVRYRW